MDVVELAVGPNDPPEAVAAVIEGHLRRGRAVACVTTVNRGNRRAPEAWTKARLRSFHSGIREASAG